MLLLLNAGVESLRVVAGQDGNLGLGEDRSGIDSGIDEMNGAAGFGIAAFESLTPSAEAGVFG